MLSLMHVSTWPDNQIQETIVKFVNTIFEKEKLLKSQDSIKIECLEKENVGHCKRCIVNNISYSNHCCTLI